MQLLKLLYLANKGYADGLVEFYEDDTGDIIEGGGDTLALFIVRELMSTFQTGVEDHAQIFEAIHAMTVAKKELESVIEALGTSEPPSWWSWSTLFQL